MDNLSYVIIGLVALIVLLWLYKSCGSKIENFENENTTSTTQETKNKALSIEAITQVVLPTKKQTPPKTSLAKAIARPIRSTIYKDPAIRNNVNSMLITQDNPGPMIEKRYGGNMGDRYGIGQFQNGEMRMYTASSHKPATLSLSFANADGSFDDRFVIDRQAFTFNGAVDANGNYNKIIIDPTEATIGLVESNVNNGNTVGKQINLVDLMNAFGEATTFGGQHVAIGVGKGLEVGMKKIFSASNNIYTKDGKTVINKQTYDHDSDSFVSSDYDSDGKVLN